MLQTDHRASGDDTLSMFRSELRKFLARELVPHLDRWEKQGIVDREFWLASGAQGLLCPTVPARYGGLGLDFRYNAVIGEEVSYTGSTVGISLQSDIVVDYIAKYASEELKSRYLPGMVSGECIVAIAMTEPGGGSDLQSIRTAARRDANDYIVTGAKTYITNGQLADLVIVAVNTLPGAGAKGLSLILIDSKLPGFAKGRKLDKIGHHSADTSELFFDNVRVPLSHLIGEENRGFSYMMRQLPQERLVIAVAAQAVAQRAFDEALEFTKQRKAFGRPVFEFQNTRFTLATLSSKLQVGWAHIDWAISRHVAGLLTAEESAAAKLWHTEMQWEAVDAALQLHGGAGYMNEYPIARLWRDSRVTRIYGGTSEIMKEIIGRSL
jgi:acyl-CoA dehydrogenase